MSRLPLLLLLALPLGATPASPVASTTTEPKPYALYLGADISIEVAGKLCPVIGARGESLIVDKDGKPLNVPLVASPVSIKISDVLRMSRGEADVHDLKVERAYTPRNDPRQRRETAPLAASPGADTVIAEIASQKTTHAADVTAQYHPAEASLLRAQGADARNTAMNNARSDMNYGPHAEQQLQRELDQKLFDAIRINFVAASTTRLEHPYVLGVAQIREADAKPGEIRYWISAKGLDVLGPEPQKIEIFDGGLPEGYEIVSFHLHVYDGGREIPTPVAAKRVPLSTQEAYQFLLLEHLSQHKHDSAPASPAVADVPAHLRAQLQADSRTYYAKITKDGRATAVYSDAGCTEPVTNAAVLEAFNCARFKPAIADGNAIDGVASVKLPQLL